MNTIDKLKKICDIIYPNTNIELFSAKYIKKIEDWKIMWHELAYVQIDEKEIIYEERFINSLFEYYKTIKSIKQEPLISFRDQFNRLLINNISNITDILYDLIIRNEKWINVWYKFKMCTCTDWCCWLDDIEWKEDFMLFDEDSFWTKEGMFIWYFL